MFQVGSSNDKISDSLEINDINSVDTQSGVIFVNNNEIVYQERHLYNPDNPEKLLFYVGKIYNQAEYKVLTPDTATLKGSRKKVNGEYIYKIEMFN